MSSTTLRVSHLNLNNHTSYLANPDIIEPRKVAHLSLILSFYIIQQLSTSNSTNFHFLIDHALLWLPYIERPLGKLRKNPSSARIKAAWAWNWCQWLTWSLCFCVLSLRVILSLKLMPMADMITVYMCCWSFIMMPVIRFDDVSRCLMFLSAMSDCNQITCIDSILILQWHTPHSHSLHIKLMPIWSNFWSQNLYVLDVSMTWSTSEEMVYIVSSSCQ